MEKRSTQLMAAPTASRQTSHIGPRPATIERIRQIARAAYAAPIGSYLLMMN